MLTVRIPLLAVLLLVAGSASATIFGSVSGLIHDPQHRPVQGAQATLRSTTSDWNKSAASDNSGEFHFDSVPLGNYRITVELAGFATQAQDLALISGRDARLHFSLTIAQTKETVEVKDTGAAINSESSTTQSVISRQQIASTPGADQTNSLAMITDYVPGANMVHDQLHIRGGHQVSWLLDGVPVPNTSIASNVGPQFDPKDIDYLEVQRGGYSAEYGDHYQVPIDPASSNILHDVENERDDFVNFSWLHTDANGVLITVSPFYHFNRAHYSGSPEDAIRSEYDRGSNFIGGVTTLGVRRGRHNFHAGFQTFGERDNQLYSVVDNSGAGGNVAPQRTIPWANVEAVFLQDQVKATRWLTLNGGLRLTHYGGPVSENAADPRIGAAIQIPRLNWVLRAFYGRYYQAPPLVTVTSPALNSDQSFLPLHGERDEQREFGLTIPLHAWTFDIANFRTGARNFFDHDVLGDSDVFFPLTIAHARIRGWEASVNSPNIASRAKFHLAYSHQYAQGAGAVTGGLTDFSPPEQGYFFLDHDQRDTLSTGFNLQLPWRVSAGFNTNYGSGFLDADGPAHLPSHTTFDLALGKSFGENWSLRLTALNFTNHRYMLDNSNTFGGTHFVNPREISLQLRYRFHY